MRTVAVLLVVTVTAPMLAAEPPRIRETITGKVVRISDGDTITLLDASDYQHRIRLYGIDAPETRQAFGTRAKQALGNKIFGKMVRVEVVDVDRYKRQVGRIWLGDRNINLEMVRDGFAWRYTHYDKAGEFTAAEAEARENRRGLWIDKEPIPPWEFRRLRQASRAAKSGASAK